jgi:hypothetical protein
MSKHHQASRRRTYGRRQHEIHERAERSVGPLGWIEESDMPEVGEGWIARPQRRTAAAAWLSPRGID